MTNSRGCEHEDTDVETASNRLNGVADPEGATRGLLVIRVVDGKMADDWRFLDRRRSLLRPPVVERNQ